MTLTRILLMLLGGAALGAAALLTIGCPLSVGVNADPPPTLQPVHYVSGSFCLTCHNASAAAWHAAARLRHDPVINPQRAHGVYNTGGRGLFMPSSDPLERADYLIQTDDAGWLPLRALPDGSTAAACDGCHRSEPPPMTPTFTVNEAG